VQTYAIFVSIVFATFSTAAYAIDENTCQPDMVCASSPASVVAALQDAGYRAQLKKDSVGEYISSAGGGYNFLVTFQGCKETVKCDSLQFGITFTPHEVQTAEYANGYNLQYRYVQAAAKENKELRLSYDVTTIGGLSKRNFTDIVDIWTRGLAGFSTYVKEQAAKKVAPAPVLPAPPAPPMPKK
jgi:Putative bacterial sensory transduction regulator